MHHSSSFYRKRSTTRRMYVYICMYVSDYSNNNVAIAKKADRTVNDVRYSCRTKPLTWRCGRTCTVTLKWR